MESARLVQWFQTEQRDLPWRRDRTPYRVWISEVMLQQTQVDVVIPYFERWMILFPTIETLALAPLEQVMKAWEGLGYYARARHLHAAAKWLTKHCRGELPQEEKQLLHIPGIGPYTARAIAAFAFHRKCLPVDANVLRVLTRYYGIASPIEHATTQREVHAKGEAWLAHAAPYLVSEALIELGALVCKKEPECFRCPLSKTCTAYLHGETGQYPVKGKKVPVTAITRIVAIALCAGDILCIQRQGKEVMSGLWEFPYFTPEAFSWDLLPLRYETCQPLPEITHAFTRFRARLLPYLLKVHEKKDIPPYQWVPYHQLSNLPFSSGHKKILHALSTYRCL